jgi:hypothetical protein
MTSRFAACRGAVVTGRTASGGYSRVTKLCAEPARRLVARIARLGCRHMSRRHWRCHNARTRRVTALTRFWCAFEYPLNVTSFTSCPTVRRIERETACTQVIKLCGFRLCVREATHHQRVNRQKTEKPPKS